MNLVQLLRQCRRVEMREFLGESKSLACITFSHVSLKLTGC